MIAVEEKVVDVERVKKLRGRFVNITLKNFSFLYFGLSVLIVLVTYFALPKDWQDPIALKAVIAGIFLLFYIYKNANYFEFSAAEIRFISMLTGKVVQRIDFQRVKGMRTFSSPKHLLLLIDLGEEEPMRVHITDELQEKILS